MTANHERERGASSLNGGVHSVGSLPVVLSDARKAVLRAARVEDAEDLIAIQRQVIAENIANVDDHVATPEEYRQLIAAGRPGTLWLVAEGEGRVIGSLQLLPPGPSFLGHVRNLYIDVLRHWRGAGVGAALIRRGIEWAGANGVELLALSVLDSNPRARELYERLGFLVTGRTPRLVKRGDGSYTDDTQMALLVNGSPRAPHT